MNLASLVNLLIEKLGGNRVRFVEIDSAIVRVDFEHAGNFYSVRNEGGTIHVIRIVDHCPQPRDDIYLRWMEGVLNGMKRNEEGVLS